MLRVRFEANPDDCRPVNWPVKHPYWCTGRAADGSYSVIVSYADDIDYILQNWPEAKNIDAEEVKDYVFTERFPKPEWFRSDATTIVVAGPCVDGDCNCRQYDGADPDVVGWPPFHGGCTCYTVKQG